MYLRCALLEIHLCKWNSVFWSVCLLCGNRLTEYPSKVLASGSKGNEIIPCSSARLTQVYKLTFHQFTVFSCAEWLFAASIIRMLIALNAMLPRPTPSSNAKTVTNGTILSPRWINCVEVGTELHHAIGMLVDISSVPGLQPLITAFISRQNDNLLWTSRLIWTYAYTESWPSTWRRNASLPPDCDYLIFK